MLPVNVFLKKGTSPELTVQMWDFAGQQDYYVTHKVFLSPSALYLVVYDLRLGKQGVDGLHTWLSDIQVSHGYHIEELSSYQVYGYQLSDSRFEAHINSDELGQDLSK